MAGRFALVIVVVAATAAASDGTCADDNEQCKWGFTEADETGFKQLSIQRKTRQGDARRMARLHIAMEAHTPCPGSIANCVANSCCPGTAENGNLSFPCPLSPQQKCQTQTIPGSPSPHPPSPGPPVPPPVPPPPVSQDWCNKPVSLDFDFHNCNDISGPKMNIKALSYNLFWWNLFGQRHGDNGSAGKLIAKNSEPHAFDFMGFQECEDVKRVLADAGLSGMYDYHPKTNRHAIALAWRNNTWDLLASGFDEVAEDQPGLWGRRAVAWGRFRNKQNGKTVFFADHHGPLGIDTGGLCGGQATADNILQVIADNARKQDALFLVGDFNAHDFSVTVRTLASKFHEVFTGSTFGGVDHIFSSCSAVLEAQDYGLGGSDHTAIGARMTV